jgi:hypothetical protein
VAATYLYTPRVRPESSGKPWEGPNGTWIHNEFLRLDVMFR